MEPHPPRLFVSIEPTPPVRESLIGLADGIARARWTPPVQFHLTLRYIGDASDDARRKIADSLATINVRPFFLAVRGAGRFPPRGHPAVIYAGVEEHPHLHQLRQQVDDRLLATGVPFELRPFVPHFTIARTADAAAGAVDQWLKRHRDFAGPAWRVDQFHLMESIPATNGAEHRAITTFPLKNAT